MNQLIAQKDKWTLAELEERDGYMVSKALKIWAYPVTEYKPEEKQLDSVTLDDDDFNPTGRQIAKFSYKDSEQVVESWTDMFARMLRILHSEDGSVLTDLAYTSDPSNYLSTCVSSNQEEFPSKVQITPNIYVWTGTATVYKLSMLRRFFALFSADPSDLVFYLNDPSEIKSSEDDPERYALRKRYWEFALPYLHEKFGENGPFSKVGWSTANWINGNFGIGGFSVTCLANYDSARVQFYLGKSDKEKNKEAFDFLYQHKTVIEDKLGKPIKWERGDDIKASYLTYELPGVSITNETDWIRMAKFHAEWSKKFCDVILPILKDLYPAISY